MNLRILALIALTLLGCSASGDENEFTCTPDQRIGRYFFDFTVISGDCGEMTDAVLEVSDPEALPAGCTQDARDVWTNNSCSLERRLTCELETGETMISVGRSEQQDVSGNRLTGTVEVTLVDPDGLVLCRGTYRLEATRQ